MPAELTVAAVQSVPLPGGLQANIDEHVRLLEDAEGHGARLAVFPELSLTGYDLSLLADGGYWITSISTQLAEIQAACEDMGIVAVVGAAVREPDGTPRLASLLLRPGTAPLIAPKMHLHGDERDLFEPGTRPTVVDVDGWRVALAVCFDVAQPGHAAEAAAAGTDLYAASSVYVAGQERRLDLHFGARAMDSRFFALLANAGGTSTLGASCGGTGIWGPDGHRMAAARGTGSEVVPAVLFRSALERYRGRH
ncbi:carbon-nitrogen hydrolase family protein [Sinomonas cellulolyticus]|uniref:Carbon-nitrogen hydrolase family protein n=1 Tax=Sinomonas cellulolyticus TaxID=2801916 RepID=A0ABS1K4Y2_9MICC|nr:MULTISPECIES: carbon-nitrogen hydrolase family protein [Sinomonas]MBL0706724.1 carbon-nitrogen hydrolase family protein [Sinomonas cellulolyticus]GHG56328.1 carbon-nitrogen hydrolase family protein [Sinomonas sp. KCTC 49339]